MSASLTRPQWVDHFNQFGPACGGAEYLLPLEADELTLAARRATGLDDFGTDPWEEGFNKLLWSLNHEANLNTMGRLMVRTELLRTLQVRLRMVELWRNHPEVLEMAVNPPVVIAGAARTGTTILQEVLSLDPQFHLPYTWRCLDPLPLDEPRDEDRARRIAKARCEAEFVEDVQPEIRAMHAYGAELPTECIYFMASDYSSDYWMLVADMPTWDAWRLENEYYHQAYRWHKKCLQTMQYREPQERTWLLKSPAHIAFLDILRATYPGVRIIHTHRDPVKCVPSTASVASTVRWERSDHVNYRGVGEAIAFSFQFSMENVINQRQDGRLQEADIADLFLHDLIADPVQAIRSIYSTLKLDYPDGMDAKVRDYLANKPKGKFGAHEYEMSSFGMDRDSLRTSFARYSEYYNITPEE
jgi:hypothetical protein